MLSLIRDAAARIRCFREVYLSHVGGAVNRPDICALSIEATDSVSETQTMTQIESGLANASRVYPIAA